jgi:tritrans,polycis-undecaprenyl-diphosphate synthase [geranylgeranyl-diphosphate specific]
MKPKNPAKIAVILDGNRRFGRKKGLMPWQGHEFGVKKVEELLEWCRDLGIMELTLYAFSMDNFKRPENEKKALFGLFKTNIRKLEENDKLKKYGIKVRFAGRLSMFPEDIQKDMRHLMKKTSKNDRFWLNFAMAYSGKSEITDSVKKIIQKLRNRKIDEKDVNEKLIEDNLYLSSSPDIFIRPGGEKRMSDFLLWQSAYSELFFIDKLWPEFTKEDLVEIIKEYKKRERRFGR